MLKRPYSALLCATVVYAADVDDDDDDDAEEDESLLFPLPEQSSPVEQWCWGGVQEQTTYRFQDILKHI